jgi:ribonucleoside-diphosphate reductase alpha chain
VVPVETEGGTVYQWVDRWLLDWLASRGHEPARVVDALAEGAPGDALAAVPEDERRLLRSAREVPPEAQLAVQARFQAHVDGGVSKTIHLPASVTVEGIVALIQSARARGCKGVAFWRSRGTTPPLRVCCP